MGLRQIQRIENGENNTGIYHLYLISKVLEISIHDLFTFDQIMDY